ncbi:hypothetical protein PR048_016786 [Dryococelus australis]|uniref:Uncharacterized protein n=1 Tax=Dryococelus australis TaxID=614101 RepID=A0ABQ9H7S4_9NEOP|nr:hypothetical protein PR048_016786 [Dryococelus australis]
MVLHLELGQNDILQAGRGLKYSSGGSNGLCSLRTPKKKTLFYFYSMAMRCTQIFLNSFIRGISCSVSRHIASISSSHWR